MAQGDVNEAAGTRADVEKVARVLRESQPAYQPLPLGNKPDPLDELIFIILTTMTQHGPMEVFDRLKQVFGDWNRLLEHGAEAKLRETIAPCGLVNQKAGQILGIAGRLKDDFGAVTLSPLTRMSDRDAEAYLLSLPRVGKKVARCVMMYSMDRTVLPVDTHVLRVARRIGLLPETTSWAKAHDAIQQSVPPELRYWLHVGLVVHGREVCTYRSPKCDRCILKAEQLCPGVAAS